MTIKEYKQERDVLVNILEKVYNNNTKEVKEIISNRLQQIVNDVAVIAFEAIDKPFSWEEFEEEDVYDY